MRGSRKFCQRGSNFDFFIFVFVYFFLFFFSVNAGREDPNTTLSGPSWARQRDAI